MITIITGAIDNNQKGYLVKHQRYEKSNKFIKVTVRYVKFTYLFLKDKNFNCDTFPDFQRYAITYMKQAIPPPSKMPCFEMLIANEENKVHYASAFTDLKVFHLPAFSNIPFNNNRKRIKTYANMISIADITENIVFKKLMSYNFTTKTFKYFHGMNIKYQTVNQSNIIITYCK